MYNSLPHLTHVTNNFRKFHEYPTVSEFEHITSTAVESLYGVSPFCPGPAEAETKDRRCQQLFKKRKEKKEEKKRRRGFLQSWAINLSSSEPLQHLSSKSFRNLSSQSAVFFCFICKGTNLPYFLDRSTVNIYIERQTDRQTDRDRDRQRDRETETERQRQSLILLHL